MNDVTGRACGNEVDFGGFTEAPFAIIGMGADKSGFQGPPIRRDGGYDARLRPCYSPILCCKIPARS